VLADISKEGLLLLILNFVNFFGTQEKEMQIEMDCGKM